MQSLGGQRRLRLLLASSSVAALLIGGGMPSAYACYTGPFTGGYTNAGPTACIVVNNTAFTGDLRNTGTISLGNPTGIAVVNSSTITGSIIDSGDISVSGLGIAIDSSSTISASGYGIVLEAVPTFMGGISNAGTVSASGLGAIGIFLETVSTFTGGISNAGTISVSGGGGHGIAADTVATFTGGISNAGTISVSGGGGYGILVDTVATFTGGISNAGTISAGDYGIFVAGVKTFTGNISNFGKISAATGILIDSDVTFAAGSAIVNTGIITGTGGTAIDASGASTAVTIDQNAGTITGAIKLSSHADVLNISGGTIAGSIVGQGSSDTINFTLGAGNTFTYAAAYGFTGINQVNINSGTVILNGTNSATTLNVNGGTLAGTGTLDPLTTTIYSGGTFAPGNGTPGTSMAITGNLAFQSGALYVVYLNPSATTYATVTGTASLAGGTVQANFAAGSYVSKQYTILTATGGLGGTTFAGLSNSNLPAGASDSLSYDTDDVFLNLTAPFSNFTGLNTNQQNVANALTNYFNTTGGIPAAFFSVSPAGLTQLSGEAATGAEQSAFQLTTEFLDLMLDPFVNGRGNLGGASGGGGGNGPPLGFAPDQQASLPPDIALAYDEVFKAAPKQQNFEQRWGAWGSAYGGSSTTEGDPGVGSHDTSAQTYGFAAGMDYHVTPHSVAGFALAGGGTGWGLSDALGSGYSQAFQFGGYGIDWFGHAYLAGALSFSNHWFTTNRTALGDQLRANFVGQSYAARLEGGYRLAALPTLGVTPYGAVQFQDFHTPAYSENDLTGGGLGLSYNAMNATDVRTELGARFDDPTLFYGKPLILFGRLAWAHDFVSDPALSAVFEALPGSAFTVNGAPIPHDSALTTAGAQYFLTANWSVIGKFEGEFAGGSQTYAGTGTLRYTW